VCVFAFILASNMTNVKDAVVYGLIKSLLVLFYVVSHIYDYLTWPVYSVWYHSWRVRRYKQASHAHKSQTDDGSLVFTSTQAPGPVNKELQEKNVKTMNDVLDHVIIQPYLLKQFIFMARGPSCNK